MSQDSKKYSTIALVLYHVVTFLEGFNLQCTPVCMRAFEMSLGLTASRLSVVFATELLSLLGIAAVWGVLIDMPGKTKGRKVNHVCSLGMLICGIACILMGCTSGFPLVLLCRFLHGAGLSCVGPVYSKIITEQYGMKNQDSGNGNDQTSTWFSVANGAHCAGKVLSLMLVSVLATRNVVGQYGWRLCYCVTGYVWLMVAVVVFFFMKKKVNGSGDSQATTGNNMGFASKKTFWVMACVMYTSETPFVMLGYMVMYFQYSGLSNRMAGFVGAVIQVAAVIGSCAGGYAAQECNKWNKDKGHGRFTFAMSVLALRFLAVISILCRPIESGELRWYHWVELFVFGLTLFVASAVDRPTVSDIAKGNESLAGSLFRVAGGVPSSATISPIIALLAERFGYIESKELLEDMDIQTRMANVNALRMSLMCVGGVLTVLNIILYIPVFFTYKSDKDQTGGSGGTDNCSNTTTNSGTSSTTSPSNSGTYPWYAIVLYHVFAFLDAYSTQSLYVCMGAFEVDLGISPSSLSIVAMAHMLSELALSPLWGFLVDEKEYHLVETIAMLIIGTTSILLACTSCYPLILVLRFLHGASLGCTGPVIQKIITRSRCDSEQATWFGIYAAVYGLGSLIGCGTNSLLSMKNLIGLYGWRLSYCILGYSWLLAAPLVFQFMRPNPGSSVSQGNNGKTILQKLKCIFKVKSYWLLVAVMFASEAAYAFMAYIPLYLQYSGLSEMAVASLAAVVVFGGMFGGLFGGKLIDWCHEKSPEYGRLGFAVDALLIRLMYITMLMWWPVPTNGLTWEHYVEAFILGATLVTIHSVDRPMLQDVVPKGSEGTALSFLRMIAGIPSSLLFPPLIANLAERVYGYVKGAGFGEGADRKVMASNANALRRSIMYIMIGATAFNIALYVGLFFTYKGDKDKKGNDGQDKQNTGCGGTEEEKKSVGGQPYPWPSVVLYHMVSFINAYDTQILSLSMRALEASLGLSASSLSIMASMEGMTLMGFAPVWGYLVSKYPCQYVCAAGMALCGISCILLAQVTTFSWILLIRLTHGIGLSCAAPVAVHIIAANWGSKGNQGGTKQGATGTNNSKDSMYSGINNGIVTLGKLICFFLTGRYAGQKVFGHSGWRLSYALVGCVWLFAALPVCLYMTKDGNTPSGGSGSGTSNNTWDQLKKVVEKPKFWVMTVVMFFSEAPYVIMGYMVMYLQYSGLSTVGIGSAIIVMQVGTAIGSVAGGVIAGKFNEWSGKYGRLSLATCALLIRLMYFVIFLWWPLNEHGLTWHRYCLLFVIGLTMLVSPTIEKPIVSDLDKDAASMTVPLYRAIGGMPSYIVFMPLLGWMAEKLYGYVKPSGDVSQLGHMVMSLNANALRRSMMWILSIATVVNIGLYVVVHFSEDLGKALKSASCGAARTSSLLDILIGFVSWLLELVTGGKSKPSVSYPWYAKVLCFVPAFVQGVNLQLLPICMPAFEITLGFSPSRLSWIPSAQIMFFLGCSPLWGLLLDKFKKKVGDVQCIATCICGISCILLGYVSHYPLVILFTVLNACGNAACIAVAPKMINEDSTLKAKPTLWFGVNWSLYCIGALITSNITVSLSMKNIGGVYGWRVCHCLVGYLWLAVAAPIFFWMKKPDDTGGGGGGEGGGGGSNDSFKEIRCIMQKTTFWLMVCVGYTSQAAFAVLVYLTMYLQSSGVPGMSIGFAFSVVMIGNLAGGFSGGYMTDEIHKLSGCYGKLSVGAVTVFIRVLAVLGFLWSPIPGGKFRWYHHIYLFVYGITFFTIKAVDISISADLAPGSLKSLTIGLVGAIGGVTSNATVVPAVGYLCENKFGYVTSTETGDPLPPEVMANNVSALRNSMLIVFVVCSIINIALYLVALATYKQDKDKKDNKACPATAVPAASGESSTQCGNSTSSENDQPKEVYSTWAKVLYHVYPAMDAIDMEILPICMRAFEVSFGLSPATLSVVGAAEQGALLLMSPLWGYLLTIIKPYQVESAAMLVCGMMCILLGTTTNYRMLVLATLIHGATLGCTGPTHQKIITSSVKKDQRDMWYGIFTGVYYMGAMASSILASRLSLRNVLGQYGWRLYYCVVGYMWLAAAVPTYYGMRPDNKSQSSGGDSTGQSAGDKNNGSFWKGIKGLFQKPSYYFMISLIYVSESCELFMGYIVIYLQYCGVRNQMAGFAISVVHMGNMIAGFIGGYAIQKIHCASKDYGKLLTGIGIIAIRLFAITVLLRKPFQGGDMRWYHYMCLLLFGVAMLNRTSIDRTMLSDFVDEKNSAIALSLCRVIAGIPSNFTFPPLIGYLAERAFGYIKTDALVEDMDAFTKVTNATALSKSLLYIMGGSCLANMALYGGMMYTYSGDVDKLKKAKACEKATEEKAAGVGGGSSESDKPSVTYPWYAKVLYHVYPAIDAFDMEILPICMRAFEVSFGLSPSSLSIVAACEQGAAFLLSPLWGFLLRYRKPYQIETPAMLVCGIMCIILGITRSYMMLVLATLVHGFVLGVTGPIHQKIITSSVKKSDRDFWYGIFTGVYYSGALLSSMLASRFSLRNVFGQYGWRFYYCAVGYMWLVAAVPTYFFMRPTGDDKNGGSKGPQQSGNNNGSIWQSIKRLFNINTYIFIITLTYVSESCELFMGYIVIYLQYCGVPNHRAGFAISAVHMGNMVAGFAGGHAVGLVHSKFNNYGKQFMGIAVVTIRMIAITLLLWRPFEGGNMRWHHYSCLLLFGVAMLNRSIIDRTIISDVVQEDDAAIALSLARAIAAIPSYFTFPPLIGYLTENVFGYIKTEELVEDMDRLTRITNATALSRSLLYIMGGSCLANMALYGGMMFTYKGDVVAKEKAAGGAGAGGPSSGSGGAATGKKEYELIAFILAAFVSFMDGFDTQILPSCMKVFEIDLGLTPSMLSVINSASFLSLLVASPLWGWLVDRYNCGYIQCIAMLLAGLTCVLHGYTSSYPVIVILTIFNGAGLACTAPIDQKIITANWSDNSGVYFGISWTCYCLGRVASSTIGSRLIMKNIAGQYGWRMYCFLTGYIWIIASIVVHFFMKKNRDAAGQTGSSSSTTCPNNGSQGGTTNDKDSFFQKLKRLSKITTFWLLIPVKYASSAPLVILSYMVMYYQNSGLSDNMAGFAVGIVQLGSGIGGTGVGWVADQIHKKENKYARIGFAIGALVLRVLCVILLLWSPLEGASLLWYQYGGLFIMGLTLFTIQTVDKAMLGNVVSKSDQSTAISLVYFAAGIPSSTTLPTFVGYMAEKRFGYVASKATDEPLHPVTMANNATALRKAMIYCMLIASFVNIIFYGATMVTYSKDVAKAKGDKKAKGAQAEEKGTVSSGEAGGGSGAAPRGGGEGVASGGSAGSPPTPGGSGGSEEGSTASGTEGGKTPDNDATSSTPGSTATSPTVTVMTTRVTCEGISISSTKTTDAKSIEVSYVGCASYSEKASTTEVAVMSSTSGANGSTTDIVAACVGAASTTESGTSGGTICGGIAVHGSNDSKSDDGTTAIVACVSADAEVSSKSKDGGTSRLVIQNCVGVAMRKTKEKGFVLAVGMSRKCAFSKTKSSNSAK